MSVLVEKKPVVDPSGYLRDVLVVLKEVKDFAPAVKPILAFDGLRSEIQAFPALFYKEGSGLATARGVGRVALKTSILFLRVVPTGFRGVGILTANVLLMSEKALSERRSVAVLLVGGGLVLVLAGTLAVNGTVLVATGELLMLAQKVHTAAKGLWNGEMRDLTVFGAASAIRIYNFTEDGTLLPLYELVSGVIGR